MSVNYSARLGGIIGRRVKWITSSLQGEQLCQIILKSMHKCISYGLDKLNLCPFYHLTFKCDLDLQPTQTNVSNGTTTPQEHMCKIIWNPWINVKVMARTNSMFDHFIICDFQPTQTNFSNGSTTLQGEHLCKIILKSMQKYRNMALTSSTYDHFIIWPSSVTLTFNLPKQMFQMALLLLKENAYAKLFWNPCINVGVMAPIS